MGSGKSTAGKWLAEKLGYEFVDLDESVEKITNMTISSIFSSKGELAFRELERKALAKLARSSGIVIATGGGTPCFSDNMNVMNNSGKTVYLKLSAENLFKRLVAEKDHRPLISGKSEGELKRYICDKLEEREVYYRKAEFVIDSDPLDMEKLLAFLL
jgi:shikimate kinase